MNPPFVVYCKVCGLPPEYCEFGPSPEKCKLWLQESSDIISTSQVEQIETEKEIQNEPKEEIEEKETVKEKEEKPKGKKGKAKAKAKAKKESPVDEKQVQKTPTPTPTPTPTVTDEKAATLAQLKLDEVKILPGGKVKKKEVPVICISRIQRNKRKYVTVVVGLEHFVT